MNAQQGMTLRDYFAVPYLISPSSGLLDPAVTTMASWTSPRVPAAGNSSKQVAELEAQVAELTRKLDEAVRAGKRQAAPFRKGPPKPDPKTPGRKSGDAHGKHGHRPPPPPEQVAECHEAHLPDACPHCRGRLVETGTADQFQTEIPRQPLIRKFRVHIGHCEACGKRTQGRHPLQTSDALGAAASQIGPDAQAAAAVLHTQMGLSHGKVASVFQTLFGITLTRGASAQIDLRAATRLEPDYQLILDEVRSSEQIAADETGWRIGGHPAWLHAWVGDRATAYAIDSQRSADALERVIGAGLVGRPEPRRVRLLRAVRGGDPPAVRGPRAPPRPRPAGDVPRAGPCGSRGR